MVRNSREKIQRKPPMPAKVLQQLYTAMADLASGKDGDAARDAIALACSIQLRPRDFLIAPSSLKTVTPSLRDGKSGSGKIGSYDSAPSTYQVPAYEVPVYEVNDARWQFMAAVQVAGMLKRLRRASAVLTLLQPPVLDGPEHNAELDLLKASSESKLPVVFVAEKLPKRLGEVELCIEGIPRIRVDGSDSVAVYRVCQEALRRAREGTGPSFIECPATARENPVVFLRKFLGRYGLGIATGVAPATS